MPSTSQKARCTLLWICSPVLICIFTLFCLIFIFCIFVLQSYGLCCRNTRSSQPSKFNYYSSLTSLWMYWSKLTLFCNKNFISFSFSFLFRLASTLLLHPTWYQTHPVMTWERHLLLIKHSLMASLFVCLLHTQHFYLPVLVLEILSCSRQKYVLFFEKKSPTSSSLTYPPLFPDWLLRALYVIELGLEGEEC